jgi:hypothetical protein
VKGQGMDMNRYEMERFLKGIDLAKNLAGSALVMVAADGGTEIVSTLAKRDASRILGDVAIQLDDSLNVIIQG